MGVTYGKRSIERTVKASLDERCIFPACVRFLSRKLKGGNRGASMNEGGRGDQSLPGATREAASGL